MSVVKDRGFSVASVVGFVVVRFVEERRFRVVSGVEERRFSALSVVEERRFSAALGGA